MPARRPYGPEALEKAHFSYDGKELQVTASFGVTEVPGSSDGAAVIARADKALYAAKEGGRNCAYLHDGEATRRILANGQPALSAAADQPPAAAAPDEPAQGDETIPTADSQTSELKSDLPPTAYQSSNLTNRTAFCRQVRNRTAEWKRGGPTFSIVLIEVDQYDEGGGHAGQQAREFASVVATRFLDATLREMDIAGSYAPGSFALLLPTAGLADAIRVAERLREGFAQYVPSEQGEPPRFTLSVGVVQVAEKDDSISLLTRAEAALNAANRRGGNRAYYHDGERCAPITAMLETMDYLA